MKSQFNLAPLTTTSTDGEKIIEKVTSEKGSYIHGFNDIYNTIRKGEVYPVSDQQIIQQLEILEGELFDLPSA